MLPFSLSSLSHFNSVYLLIPHLFNVYYNAHFIYPEMALAVYLRFFD